MMLGKGVQRVRKMLVHSEMMQEWHGTWTTQVAVHPPLKSLCLRFLSMPGAVSDCTRQRNHLLLLDSLVRGELWEASWVKASHHNKRFLSPRTPPPPARGGRRLSRTVDSWQGAENQGKKESISRGEGQGNEPHSLAEGLGRLTGKGGGYWAGKTEGDWEAPEATHSGCPRGWRATGGREVILGRTPSPTPRPEDGEEMALYRRMKGRQEGHQAGRDRGCPGAGTTPPAVTDTAALPSHPLQPLVQPPAPALDTPAAWSGVAPPPTLPSRAHLPTKFSSTELLPALWPPTTAIWGSSSRQLCPQGGEGILPDGSPEGWAPPSPDSPLCLPRPDAR